MLLGTNDSYYSYPFKGLILYFEDGTSTTHPTIMLNLLSVKDIARIRLLESYGIDKNVIHEDICKRCIIGILHLDDKKIDFDNSPAGVLETIATTIIVKSKGMEAELENVFYHYADSVNIFDQMQVIISRYTNTPIKDVKNYPIDKLIKEYAILHKTFPKEVLELKLEVQEG